MINLWLRPDTQTWYIKGTIVGPDGEKIKLRQKTSFKKAQKQYAKQQMDALIKSIYTGDYKYKPITLKEACTAYITRPESVSFNSIYILNRFTKHIGGDRPLHSIPLADFHSFWEARNIKPGTVQKEMTIINAMMNYCEQRAGLKTPPFRLKHPKVTDKRIRWLTEEQRDEMINVCTYEIKSLLIFLFYTGCRLREALNLQWDDFIMPNTKDKQGAVIIRSIKGNKSIERKVPLVPLFMQEHMKNPNVQSRYLQAEYYVFTDPNGRKWTEHKFTKYFKIVCQLAGISNFTPRDCRHTFASQLAQAGVDLYTIGQLLGHTNPMTTQRYAHLKPSQPENTVNIL